LKFHQIGNSISNYFVEAMGHGMWVQYRAVDSILAKQTAVSDFILRLGR